MISTRTWKGYAVSGQSNALGNNNGDLSASLVAMPAVSQMHNYSTGVYAAGTARAPVWWSSAVESSNRVCPGAGLAQAHAVASPTLGFRLCKDAVGGSSMAEWLSTFAPRHIATMQATGWTFDGGLVWAQGEEDAKAEGSALAYEGRLGDLFDAYRVAFPGLKVCIVKLASDFTPLSGTAPYIAEIRAAQVAYAASDALCTIIDLDDYVGQQYDGVHWTGPIQLVCGQRAHAALALL